MKKIISLVFILLSQIILLSGCINYSGYESKNVSSGVYKETNPTLLIDCELPKTFKSSEGEITIESIKYEYDEFFEKFDTFWSGTCGLPYKTKENVASYRSVGYKLYDPDGYVVASGNFYSEDLVLGDKFRDGLVYIGYRKVKGSGVYKLELMDVID